MLQDDGIGLMEFKEVEDAGVRELQVADLRMRRDGGTET